MRQRGIEPRAFTWEANMFTITPLALFVCFFDKISKKKNISYIH
jgi:hypothetical protein